MLFIFFEAARKGANADVNKRTPSGASGRKPRRAAFGRGAGAADGRFPHGELQGQGHAIEAVQNKGYTLRPESDVLSEQGVRLYLRHSLPRVVVEQTLISTNLTAKQLAAEGAPHGTLVAANHQTGGRGRRGRSFASPPGTGLYLSMVLRRALPMQNAVLVTSAAAVAVCRAVEAVSGKRLGIKWVNDLYFYGKKCCGILTEAAADVESGGLEHLVVGIGVNLYEPRRLRRLPRLFLRRTKR